MTALQLVTSVLQEYSNLRSCHSPCNVEEMLATTYFDYIFPDLLIMYLNHPEQNYCGSLEKLTTIEFTAPWFGVTVYGGDACFQIFPVNTKEETITQLTPLLQHFQAGTGDALFIYNRESSTVIL